MTTDFQADLMKNIFFRTNDEKHMGGDVPLNDKKIKLE